MHSWRPQPSECSSLLSTIYDGSSADAERYRAQQSGYATAEVLRLVAVLLESPQWDAADR
jgi:hypothetical protein